MVKTNCSTCGKELTRSARDFEKYENHFCSIKCKSGCQINRVARICQWCGVEFQIYPSEVRKGGGKHCSIECYNKAREAARQYEVACASCGKKFTMRKCEAERYEAHYCSRECQDASRKKGVLKQCLVCGKAIYVKPYEIDDVKYCSRKCQGKAHQGEKCPAWKGGITFLPYCHKFNDSFKVRTREKFGNRCFLCGGKNERRVLSIHHIDYAKNSICNGKEWAFVPLCDSCHGKTNFNRWHWFNLLIYYWIYEIPGAFDGISNI